MNDYDINKLPEFKHSKDLLTIENEELKKSIEMILKEFNKKKD